MDKYPFYRLMACWMLACSALFAQAASESLKICGQNLQNYYWNYDQTERTTTNYLWVSNYSDEAGRALKTHRIVNALLTIDADIYAFNELEATDIILKQLADSLTKYGKATYAAVQDDISYTFGSGVDNHLKSGFIYRTDKVKPYGSNKSGATAYYYRDVMRIQTFEGLASGERMTLSINHFKAGGEEYEDARVTNATQLLTALPKNALDEDILILGDLNCEQGAASIQKIEEAGYEEQLLKYGTSVYTHCYDGGRHLDHVLANATMARQITRAWVEHVCTTCYVDNDYRTYSDHDPYVVTLRLSSSDDPIEEEDIDFSESFASTLGSFTPISVTGDAEWGISSSYKCAMINGYYSGENEDWLVSPSFDFRGKIDASVSFTHCVGYGNTAAWPEHLKLVLSANYTDEPGSATWTEVSIPAYGSRNWDWQTVSVDVPQTFLGQERVNVAFYYKVETSSDAPQWEIKDFHLQAQAGGQDGIADGESENPPTVKGIQKVFVNGGLYLILPDGRRYTLQGIAVK